MEMTFEPGVAGCDEAGRGPLAGPVVCAAVVLPPGFDASLVADSKTLAPGARQNAAEAVRRAAEWAVVVVEPEEIEALNVLWATMAGMARALAALPNPPKAAWIDGPYVPRAAPVPCRPLVKGDSINAAVAAASILAKVARDEIMVDLDARYPGYGFSRHFGYPTPSHLEALRKLGPSPVHRRGFAPVAAVRNRLESSWEDA